MSSKIERIFSGPALKINAYLDKLPKIYNVFFIASISTIAGMMFGFDISSMSAFIGSGPYMKFFHSPGSDIQGIISGVGVGFGSAVAPIYGAELAPRKIRGFIGGMFQFFVTLGILIMFYISFGLGHINGVASFRIAWGLQIVPGLCLFLGCFFIPESPRWLAKQGQWEAAEEIVAKVQAHGDRENPDVLIEISEIKDQLLLEQSSKHIGYATLFTKKYIYRTFTAIFAQIWQQLTGMNVMMYYIVYIFQMAGYSGNSNLVASSIQYVINTCVTAPALYFIDKIGRRPLLIGGATMMMAFQFGLAGILGNYSVPWPESGNDSVNIRIPLDNKSAQRCHCLVAQRGNAISTSANWILNFAIAMYTPSGFKNISWKTYIIYGVFCLAMGTHVYFGFPETKGKRLEEIGQMWEENVPAWRSRSWQPTIPIASDAELARKMEVEHQEDKLMNDDSNSESKENQV
ncbi:Sugar (and other) transporter family protein [Candida albicans]|uniref:Sugar (And other) transporter family protein n=1 Tax=Candida albicans TaxID=5476 RepID=A0A8H6C0H9_CANAX|nr:Sugar (and other) transporter family protein [Candida albicans]